PGTIKLALVFGTIVALAAIAHHLVSASPLPLVDIIDPFGHGSAYVYDESHDFDKDIQYFDEAVDELNALGVSGLADEL
ncbi:hypothetical protein H4R34_006104, partial [Dimargaris verticillata]